MPDVKYQILRADKEGCPPLVGYEYDLPQEAALAAKIFSKQMGEKLIVKPIVNHKWHDRERGRFRDETYRHLPWTGATWWNSPTAYAIHQHHYAHPSKERPGYIAYTKNAEDGMKDKQTILRPGAYLKKYFEQIMENHGASERKMVEMFMLAYGPIEVKFATTEDEIIAVYERGPDTCMKGRDWHYSKGRSPAFVYANGDLQVAYLGDLNKASARVLVWPEKKIFSRVYGDIARLTQGLERLGYKWGAPIGAKLQRVKLKDVKFDPNKGPPTACFVVPYLDKKNQAGGGHLSIMDRDDHLEICEEGLPGSHHCGLPEGYSGQYVPREDEYPTFTCQHCDTPGFRQLTTVYTNAENERSEDWCPRCAKAHGFNCRYSGEWYSSEDVNSELVDGITWNKYYADMYAARCAKSGALTQKENLIKIYFNGTPLLVSATWIDNNGGHFKSGISGRNHMRTERVLVRSNYLGSMYMAKSELNHHAFQCETCKLHWSIGDRHQSDDKLYCDECYHEPKLGLNQPGIPKSPKLKRSQLSGAASNPFNYDAALDRVYNHLKEPEPRF